MSEYKCNSCETLHTTENMAAFCATCYSKIKQALSGRTVSCSNCNEAGKEIADLQEENRLVSEQRDDMAAKLEAAEARAKDLECELADYEPCGKCFKAIERAEAAELSLSQARQRVEELEGQLERVHIALMRYESYHDRDPERKKLWVEVKEAFVIAKPEAGV